MKMKKKISLLLMVCVTVAGLLAGCGSHGTGNQKNTEDAASTQGRQRTFCGKRSNPAGQSAGYQRSWKK